VTADDALSVLGSAWRGDWSEFDGRTLRDQLDSWIGMKDRGDDPEAWLRSWGVCPVCRSWRDYCDERETHWPVAS
jgi:hypothetical protein